MTAVSRELSRLASKEFLDEIGFVLPSVPMHRLLRSRPEVQVLKTSLKLGRISEKEVRLFVSGLLRTFEPGCVFAYDMTLAAIAAAMEHWSHSFAEEYLLDLARVLRNELRCSCRVARECLKARFALPVTQVNTARYPQGESISKKVFQGLRAVTPSKCQHYHGNVQWSRYQEVANAWS